MEKRGQISVEYIMIIAVSLMILLPGVYLFRNYAFESNDRLLESKVNEIASSILLRAKKMHYFGPPSKSIVQVEMPSGINSMYIMNKDSEYLLVFKILTTIGEKELMYSSDIPLKVENPVECSFSCEYCTCFSGSHFSKGIKNIKVESSKTDELFYVNIDEVSFEVANG